MTVEEAAGELVVAVGEDVGFDANDVADDALYGEAAAVELGPNVLDDDATGLLSVGSGFEDGGPPCESAHIE